MVYDTPMKTRRVHNRFGGGRDLAYFEGETRDACKKKNRSGKRDFKYGRERDYAFLNGRDAGKVYKWILCV